MDFYFSRVYLDGEIESLCHYDICAPTNPEDFPENIKVINEKFVTNAEGECEYRKTKYLFLKGIYPCIVDGKYECTAYIWHNAPEVEENISGLFYNLSTHNTIGHIVLNTDEESKERAQRAYDEWSAGYKKRRDRDPAPESDLEILRKLLEDLKDKA